jgi:hypothetical protein
LCRCGCKKLEAKEIEAVKETKELEELAETGEVDGDGDGIDNSRCTLA